MDALQRQAYGFRNFDNYRLLVTIMCSGIDRREVAPIIGIQNNNLVGRTDAARATSGARRRSSTRLSYPKLMWNGRFSRPPAIRSTTRRGSCFPLPEGTTTFPAAAIPSITHLLVAQAHIPPTELVEVAGFTGTPARSARSSTSSTTVWAGGAAAGRQRLSQRADPAGGAGRAERDAGVPRAIRRTLSRRRRRARRSTSRCSAGRSRSSSSRSTFADAPIDRFARGDRRR